MDFKKVLKSGLFPGDWILLKTVMFAGLAIYFGYCAIAEYHLFMEIYSGVTRDILNPDILELPVNKITDLLGSNTFLNATIKGKQNILLNLKDEINKFLQLHPELPQLAVKKANDVIQLCTNLANDLTDEVNKETFKQNIIEAKKIINEIKSRKE